MNPIAGKCVSSVDVRGFRRAVRLMSAQQGETMQKVAEDVLHAMRGTNDYFCETVIAKKDFSAVCRVYSANASVLPPGAPLVTGVENIRQFWSVAVEGLGIEGASLTTLSVEMTGDSAVEIGEATLELKAGGPLVTKYIVHWKQEGGTWLWDKDI